MNRKELLAALKRVQPACAERTMQDIFRMVKLSAASGLLIVSATNNMQQLKTLCGARVKTKGEGCTSAERLRAFLENVDTEAVTLVDTGNKLLRVEAGKASFLIEYIQATGHGAALDGKLNRRSAKPIAVRGLVSALNKIAYAIDVKGTRPVLQGVLFKFLQDNQIELVAADGFQMAVTRLKYKGDIHFKRKDPRQFILPSEAVELLQRGKADDYMFYIQDNYMEFHAGMEELDTFTINGTYPDYQKLIPDNKSRVVIDHAETMKALKQFTVKEYKEHAVRIEPKRGGVRMSAVDTDGHKIEFSVTGKAKAKIAFNPVKFKAMMNHVPEGNVVMKVGSPSGPATVKDKDTLHIIMPMFVQW